MDASVTAGRTALAGIGLRSLMGRYGELAGYAVTALAVYVGWVGRHERNIDAGHGVGYAIGIVGGVLMLLLLLYSARKRARWMGRLGATRHWFRAHMLLGVIGPVLVLYHCNFELGDLNSRVALYCTLLVAVSGVVGRFLYEGIHHGLFGSRATLRELSGGLEKSMHGGKESWLIAPLRAELAALDARVLTPPDTLVAAVGRHLAVSWQTRVIYRRLMRRTRRELMRRSMTSAAVDLHAERLGDSVRRYLAGHLAQVREVARFNAFERLFSLWHIVHVPFFLMMIVTAVFHVVAVHLY